MKTQTNPCRKTLNEPTTQLNKVSKLIDNPRPFGPKSHLNNNLNSDVLEYKLNISDITFHDFLKEISSILNEIEKLRCELALKNDFCLKDIFKLFENENSEIITLYELKLGFNLFEVFPTNEEIKLLVSRFSLDEKNLLKYN